MTRDTKTDQNWSAIPKGERVLVGKTVKARAPHANLNLISQTRQEITEADIDELKQKLIRSDSEGRRYIKLIQPPTVGRFTRKQLEGYLKELNSTWGSNHTLGELTPNTGDGDEFLIVVAGHRRVLAVGAAAQELGISVELVDMEFTVEEGDELTFHEAVKTQYQENFHKKPESWEDAFAVNAIYTHGTKVGRYNSYTDCADDLGITTERVANAYRFETLPDSIRELVVENVLSYQKAIMLTELFSVLAYVECADNISGVEKANMLNKQRFNKLHLPAVMEFVDDEGQRSLGRSFVYHAVKATELPKDKLRGYINSTIESLLNNDQLMLEAVSEAQIRAEEERKLRIANRKTAIDSLKSIIAVLRADRERLENGEPGLLSITPAVNHLLHRAIHHLIENQGLFSDAHQQSLDDLKRVLEAVEEGQEIDLSLAI